MMEGKLPKGWKLPKLVEVVDLNMGQSPPSISYNENGDGMPFFQGKAEFGKIYPRIKKFTTDPKKVTEKNSILLSVRAPVGPTNLAPEKCCIGRGLAGISSKTIPYKFIFYFFRNIESELSQQGTGTTFSAISKTFLQNLDFPLPPLPEQQRIVAKLDTLFGHLDVLREKLDRIPELLKNFRQQVLTQAVTGELTKEWREGKELGEWEVTLKSFLENRDKEFRALKKADLPYELRGRKPEYLNYSTSELKSYSIVSWYTAPIGLICDSIVPGRDKPKSFTGHIPWVTMPVLNKDIIEEVDAQLFLSDSEIQEVKAKIIPTNSVIMSIVGRFGIGSILKCRAVINQQLHAFLPTKVMLPEFLLYQIKTSENYLNQISTSTTVAYINKSKANSLPVVIPSIEEQEEIVNRVESLFSSADKIESQYQILKGKIDQLPQAILNKAFRGELVEQEMKEYVREVGEVMMAAEEDIKMK
jgi:type I restriction enzyme S subunit